MFDDTSICLDVVHGCGEQADRISITIAYVNLAYNEPRDTEIGTDPKFDFL